MNGWMMRPVFVSRVGFIYEYEFGGFTVAPQLHWDWHDGHEDAIVAGIALGFGFWTEFRKAEITVYL